METQMNNAGREISRANKHFTLSLFNDSFCKHWHKDDLTLWDDHINSSLTEQGRVPLLTHMNWIQKFKSITFIKKLGKIIWTSFPLQVFQWMKNKMRFSLTEKDLFPLKHWVTQSSFCNKIRFFFSNIMLHYFKFKVCFYSFNILTALIHWSNTSPYHYKAIMLQ